MSPKGFDRILKRFNLKQYGPMWAFFIPLALTSLLTTVTHTLFNAGLARLSRPDIYMSAFPVAKSVMHLFESPIAMLRQTYSALVVDQESMKKVRTFCTWLIGILAILFALFIYSPVSYLVFTRIMNLSGDTLTAAINILRVIFFFPIFSAIRNYHQGILIKFKATPMLTISTIGRLIYTSLFVMFIGKITVIPGSYLAGLMFLTALMVEMTILIIGKKMLIGNPDEKIIILNQLKAPTQAPTLTYRAIFSFIGPLMIMAIIRALNTPLVNAGLGQTASPEIALAAYSVGWGLGNIAVSPLGSFHQIPISFGLDTDDIRNKTTGFAVLVATISTIILGIVGYTGVGRFLLTHWIKAPTNVIEPANQVLQWMVILPFLVIVREYHWGMLMYSRKTKYLSWGKVVNVLSLAITMFILSFLDLANPALVGVIGMLVCEITEISFLFLVSRKEKQSSLGTTV